MNEQKIFAGDKIYNPIEQEFQTVTAVWPEKTSVSPNGRSHYQRVAYRVAVPGFSCLQEDARKQQGEQA